MHRSLYFVPLVIAAALSAQDQRPMRPALPPAPLAAPSKMPRAIAPASLPGLAQLDFDLNDMSSDLREMNMQYSYQLATSELALSNFNYAYRTSPLASTFWYGGGASNLRETPRSAWASDDPADSLYKSAREQLNRGDYRRAVASFAEISRKFPSSVYATDAPYYQAFALYRIGGTPELQEALTILENYRATGRRPITGLAASAALAASARFSSPRGDADALAARIAGVLSNRGLADNAAVKRALSARGEACDREEQSVRAEALSALMQSDPASARQMATKILARRDECSVPMRRSALFLVGNQKDEAATAAIVNAAKNDPAMEIRTEAVTWLGRLPGDAALNALEEMVRGDTGRVQRVAAGVLASSNNPRARGAMRALVERNDVPEALRVAVIDGMRSSVEDAAWWRAAYAKVTSTRVKERLVYWLNNSTGDANTQWLSALIQNEDEPIEARMAALRSDRMTVAALSKLYNGTAQGRMRDALISALTKRTEPEAVDKLIDIARNDTDPAMRRMAISALARSRDPRANKLLLELVDK